MATARETAPDRAIPVAEVAEATATGDDGRDDLSSSRFERVCRVMMFMELHPLSRINVELDGLVRRVSRIAVPTKLSPLLIRRLKSAC
jgi:hypothetical protein